VALLNDAAACLSKAAVSPTKSLMSATQPYRLIDLIIFATVSLPSTIQGLNDAKSTALRIADSANSVFVSASPFDHGEALRCYKSWESNTFQPPKTDEWRRCFPTKILSPSDFQTFTATSILQTIKRIGPGSTYEDCDRITRFKFSPNASITTTRSLITMTDRVYDLGNWTAQCTSSSTSPPPMPPLPCKVPPAFCDDLWASYASKFRTFSETEPFQTVPGRPVLPCVNKGQCVLDFLNEVVLLYWPPKLTSRDICASNGLGSAETISVRHSSTVVTTISEITFRGTDLYRLSWIAKGHTHTWKDPVVDPTTITGPWVLTSPNIYLAHRPITAVSFGLEDGSLGDFSLDEITETIRTAGLITLQSDDLYSQRPSYFKTNGGVELARKIANGLWRAEPGQLGTGGTTSYETERFDFGHLKDPVPARVYFDAREDCWGEQTHCATITDDSYRPKLLVKRHVWRSYLSNHYFCALPSIIDPPIALQSIEFDDFDAGPTLPRVFPAQATPTNLPEEGRYGYGFGPREASPHSVPRPFWRPRPTATAGPGRGSGSDMTEAQGDSVRGQQAANNPRLYGGQREHINPGGLREPAAVNSKNGQSREFCVPLGYLLSVLGVLLIHFL
jgi:hypothetical protein